MIQMDQGRFTAADLQIGARARHRMNRNRK